MPTNCQVYAAAKNELGCYFCSQNCPKMPKVDSQTNLCTLLKLLELQFHFPIKHVWRVGHFVLQGAFYSILPPCYGFSYQYALHNWKHLRALFTFPISSHVYCIVDVT